MPVYSVHGKLGTGKSKFCVWMILAALKAGRKVASNLDLDLTKLTPRQRSSYVRVPDKPTAHDLEALGHGNPDSYDEDKNGLLVLDELGTWLNARSFNDKDRAPVLDWFAHSRKHGWDMFLICQDEMQIDKQARVSFIEYSVRCMRLDRVKLPFVGGFLNDVFGGRVGYLPKMHVAAARLGEGQSAIVAERWIYKGTDLHAAYDTRQVFRSDYPHAAHSVLPPWDWAPSLSTWQRLRQWLRARSAAVRAEREPRRTAPRSPKHRVVALIETFHPDERMHWLRRAERAGLLA